MARAPAEVEVCYSVITGVVAWSGGKALLRKGDRFAVTDPLVLARPDLFGASDPCDVPRSSLPPPRGRRYCWVCREPFTPGQGHQVYCSGKCRRARERSLARATRWVLDGRAGDPGRPPDGCTKVQALAFVAELEGRLRAATSLYGHLRGRADPAGAGDPLAPPSRDPEVAVRVAKPELRGLAAKEVTRLSAMVADERRWAEHLGVPKPVDPRAAEQAAHRARRVAALGAATDRWLADMEGSVDGDGV
jgi:hypothetical protein